MGKKIVDLIIDLLIQENIHYIFGVTGKAISPFIDAILNDNIIHFISAKHEANAALMAFGYAQGSDQIGVCCATTGGGATNLTTGVATAYMNSIPLLVFTGQTATTEFARGAFQESTGYGQSINVVDLFKPITKESFSINIHQNILEKIQYAIKSATSGRMGPVHINIPVDIQNREVDHIEIPQSINHRFDHEACCSTDAIITFFKLFEQSKHPLLLMGWGSVLSSANRSLVEIAEILNIPIITTIQGKGAISANHHLALGVIGLAGHHSAKEYLFEQCDLLIAVGTSFGEFSTYNWNKDFSKHKKIVQIDIDSRELGKNYPIELPLIGDASAIATQIKEAIPHLKPIPKRYDHYIQRVIDSGIKYQSAYMIKSDATPIKPQRLMGEIRKNAPDNTLFLADSGSHFVWAAHYIPIYQGGNYYPTFSLGSMGASIPSAIGVKLSHPQNPVICICGDGSFLLSGNEIATAAQYNIPVIWIILNDSKYSLPELSIKKMFHRIIGTTLPKIDFSDFAKALNVTAYRVEDPTKLSEVITKALLAHKPIIIDVVIDPKECPPIGDRKL